jgi:hypothetical protein
MSGEGRTGRGAAYVGTGIGLSSGTPAGGAETLRLSPPASQRFPALAPPPEPAGRPEVTWLALPNSAIGRTATLLPMSPVQPPEKGRSREHHGKKQANRTHQQLPPPRKKSDVKSECSGGNEIVARRGTCRRFDHRRHLGAIHAVVQGVAFNRHASRFTDQPLEIGAR